MLTSIVAAVIILGGLIIVHEAGHFLVAKRSGVRVLRFSIGYPPKIFGIRWGSTEYAIGATPLGGYVRMLGEEISEGINTGEVQLFLTEIGDDLVQAAKRAGHGQLEADPLHSLAQTLPAEPDHQSGRELIGRPFNDGELELLQETRGHPTSAEAIKALAQHHSPALSRWIESQAFPHQPLSKRFAIVLAGPLSNIVFAPFLLAFVFMYGVPRLLPVIGQAKAGMPAAQAGLRTGDRIIAIDGQPLDSWEELSDRIKGSHGAPLILSLRHPNESQVQTLRLTPARESEKGTFGPATPQWVIGVLPRGDAVVYREGPARAIVHSVMETGQMTELLVVGIAKLFVGSTPLRQALGGPIMIAKMAGNEARQGFANVALFTVMLSLELGIINLLPVPMLDGGHLLFFAIEGLRGRPLKVRHREIAQQVGLFLLMMLMAFVIFNDISRIVQG